ncbi:growth hormone receptor-like isoform X2 [Myripristis murdjan]|uniref:Growth hormone receptor b n=2 Tax=Myripristis murdjan TaxID=586833 RepID=A0A667XB67_9TELE|nr:growth hormone receptor-like isoform X2 [Myripristis murdjan]
MATALSVLLFLHIMTVSAQESPSDQVLPQKRPHLTGCVSANMETFRCRWNAGTFLNLSEPGDLRLFYINKKPTHVSPKEWSECPHYSTDRADECFFNENYTSIWTYYSVQLRSRDQSVLYDEDFFHVEEIVRPDPPVGLNWTLLNVSLTGTHFDIMVSWVPPQSADVETGWMTLQYEVQYREASSALWKVVDLQKSTQRSLYGLQTNVNHEVRVRCRMHGLKHFGEFSNSVFIHIPSKVSRFPVAVLLIFAALCLVGILMLVIVSQQQKLMVILLPPVPGPKIRGIDPELLKKGKLGELTSILGGYPELRPELYNSDPWVEFIDLDIEEQTLTDLDTDCLVDRSLSSNCSPVSIGFRDDDSGRASCCDPDLPSDPEASPLHPLLPNRSSSSPDPSDPVASDPSSPVHSPTTGEPPFAVPGREDLYTQVSEVRPSGEVLLAPEEQTDVEKTTSKDTEKETGVEKEKENAKKEIQLLVVNADHGGYTSELDAGKLTPRMSAAEMSESCQREDSSSVPSQAFVDYQRPYLESDMTPVSPLPPAPVYTMVEGVDRQNSLLLTPNPTPAPQTIIQKALPTPGGYLTPDLLGDITP